MQSLSETYESKRKQLNDNETFTQLGALEQKLRHHESNNFHLRECNLFWSNLQDIQQKTAESDYKPIAKDIHKIMGDINSQLTKLMSQLPASTWFFISSEIHVVSPTFLSFACFNLFLGMFCIRVKKRVMYRGIKCNHKVKSVSPIFHGKVHRFISWLSWIA